MNRPVKTVRFYRYPSKGGSGSYAMYNSYQITVSEVMSLMLDSDVEVILRGTATHENWFNYLLTGLLKKEKEMQPSPAIMNRIIMNGGFVKYLEALENRLVAE